MLPKIHRLGKKDIDLLFKEVKPIVSPVLNIRLKLYKESVHLPRFSFIVPKNVIKLAVHRNRLRRIGYKVLEKHIFKFPLGIIGVFIFKKYEDNIYVLENEVKSLLNRIN